MCGDMPPSLKPEPVIWQLAVEFQASEYVMVRSSAHKEQSSSSYYDNDTAYRSSPAFWRKKAENPSAHKVFVLAKPAESPASLARSSPTIKYLAALRDLFFLRAAARLSPVLPGHLILRGVSQASVVPQRDEIARRFLLVRLFPQLIVHAVHVGESLRLGLNKWLQDTTILSLLTGASASYRLRFV